MNTLTARQLSSYFQLISLIFEKILEVKWDFKPIQWTHLASSSDPGATGNFSSVHFSGHSVKFLVSSKFLLVSSGISLNFQWNFTEFFSRTWVTGNQWPFIGVVKSERKIRIQTHDDRFQWNFTRLIITRVPPQKGNISEESTKE